MFYNIKLDENGYVSDLTMISPAPPEYTRIEVGTIPSDVMCGYYKLENNEFVLDEAKKTEFELNNPIIEDELI